MASNDRSRNDRELTIREIARLQILQRSVETERSESFQRSIADLRQNMPHQSRYTHFSTRGMDAEDFTSDTESDMDVGGKAKKKTPDSASEVLNTPLDPADVGMTPDYKLLYSGKEDKRGRFQWQAEIPKDVGKPAEDAESEKWALIVRRTRVYNDPKKVLSMHSIVVQSPLIKDLLADVLAGYPGITTSLKRLEFYGRFEPLIHRWGDLQSAIDALKDKQSTQVKGAEDYDEKISLRIYHAELLDKLLAEEFTEVKESMIDMKDHGVITYDQLWTLFEPNTIVYSKQDNQDRAFRLHSSKYGFDRDHKPCFWLTCQYVDYDGTRFGTNKLNINVPEFEGTSRISSLAAFPIQFHGQVDELKEKLIERGGKIEGLAGSHYRNYNGVGWRLGQFGNKDKFTVKGRIVIDTFGFNRFNPDHAVYVTPLTVRDTLLPPPPPDISFKIDTGALRMRRNTNMIIDNDYDGGGMPADGFFDEEHEASKAPALTAEEKLICNSLVRGYALKQKEWLNLFVNAVQDISFNDKAFESLVMPKKQKELILGFTTTKHADGTYFDDVIAGKGRGVIILLCGPPGVGKTLTAESVSEQMQVPLYMMSAGDLGLDPRSVEIKLQEVLDMCTRWNAILLLDEADVFLEKRNLHELERNKLVSIFLRTLEYYEGIMFLTTNRVETFDPAFQSRIHISLEYSELDYNSRKSIWHNFLNQHNAAQAAARENPLKAIPSSAKSAANTAVSSNSAEAAVLEKEKEARRVSQTQAHALSDDDVRKLAQMKLNGRQIKNILKTAQLYATYECKPLGYDHVDMVMDVTQHLHNATRESQQTKDSLFS